MSVRTLESRGVIIVNRSTYTREPMIFNYSEIKTKALCQDNVATPFVSVQSRCKVQVRYEQKALAPFFHALRETKHQR